MNKGKRYAELAKLVDRSVLYDPSEAAKLVCETGKAKFDETVELHVRLGVDSRHADQQVRGAVVLPHGTGRTKRVLVLAKGPKADEAKEAGADFVGDDDMITKIEKENWFDFDVIVATPDMMGELGKLGKLLGPKGLMPNPKTGTVTMDLKKAVDEIKKGKVTYRTDKEGNIKCAIGKVSFTDEQLVENWRALYDVILKARPAAVKGTYMKNVTVCSSMSPSIKVDHAI